MGTTVPDRVARGPGRLAGAAEPPSAAGPVAGDSDVCVYGGTAAGVVAAVQAARMGRSVVLIEPGGHLGGMTSNGLGATDHGKKPAIGGVAREFYRRVAGRYADAAAWKFERRQDYRSHGHDFAEDAMWYFEPHVAEAICEMLREAGAVVFAERLDRERRAEGRPPDRLDRHGVGPQVPRPRVHRRQLRRRPDGQGRRVIPGRPRVERDLRGDARRRAPAGDDTNSTVPVDPYVVPGDPSSGLLPGIQPGGPGARAPRTGGFRRIASGSA